MVLRFVGKNIYPQWALYLLQSNIKLIKTCQAQRVLLCARQGTSIQAKERQQLLLKKIHSESIARQKVSQFCWAKMMEILRFLFQTRKPWVFTPKPYEMNNNARRKTRCCEIIFALAQLVLIKKARFSEQIYSERGNFPLEKYAANCRQRKSCIIKASLLCCS